jgi:hypothetical protein
VIATIRAKDPLCLDARIHAVVGDVQPWPDAVEKRTAVAELWR